MPLGAALQHPVIPGVDFLSYRAATARWLAGGPFYEPYQLAGRYAILSNATPTAVLYPPVDLWLFAPFVFLPAILWWLIPLGVAAWVLWHLRPSRQAWIAMLVVVAVWPDCINTVLYGNPAMWVAAALFAGVLFRWPAAFVLLKPSLFPFAAIGMRDRGWWIALAVGIAACLPFGAMWSDWWRAAIVNPINTGLLYSLNELPLMCLPSIAYAGRSPSQRDPGELGQTKWDGVSF